MRAPRDAAGRAFLGDAVPEDHLVRKIDTALDLSWLRSELTPHYSSIRRPSIDPEGTLQHATKIARELTRGGEPTNAAIVAVEGGQHLFEVTLDEQGD
jgi:hypothetical protein